MRRRMRSISHVQTSENLNRNKIQNVTGGNVAETAPQISPVFHLGSPTRSILGFHKIGVTASPTTMVGLIPLLSERNFVAC